MLYFILRHGKCLLHDFVVKDGFPAEMYVKRGVFMGNLIEFGRMFLSYGLLLLIVTALAAAAIFIGITMAKKKNARLAAGETEESSENGRA